MLENSSGFKMKKLIFRYLLVIGAIASTSFAVAIPAQANPQPDNSAPAWANQLWNPQSVITISLLADTSSYVLVKKETEWPARRYWEW
jgi:hypothetical protein